MRSECEAMQERLGAYRDGELAAADARTVEQHVAVCAECRAELAALDEAMAMLRERWDDGAAADAFAGAQARLDAALAAEPDPAWMPARTTTRAWWRRGAVGWTGGALAAAATILVALHVSTPPPPRPHPAAAPAGAVTTGPIEPQTIQRSAAKAAPPRVALESTPVARPHKARPVPIDEPGSIALAPPPAAEQGAEPRAAKALMRTMAADTAPAPLSLADTAQGAAQLAETLARDTATLRGDSSLPPLVRAARWRIAAALHEWLARTTQDGTHAELAIAALREAQRLAPEDTDAVMLDHFLHLRASLPPR